MHALAHIDRDMCQTPRPHHMHCRHQWVKRSDSESLQAELAAAWWAWLGPTLLVRAYDGGGHVGNGGLTPGQRRKLSIELAGKHATLAETGVWIKLLRLYVRDLSSREVDARGDGTHALQQSTTLRLYKFSRPTHADRRSYKLQLRFTRWLPLKQMSTRHWRIKTQCAAIKQATAKFSPPPAKLVKRMARGVVLVPAVWRDADISAIGRSEGEAAVLREWTGTRTQAVAQMGFAAQAPYWSAVDLHKAVMTSICEALNRPL